MTEEFGLAKRQLNGMTPPPRYRVSPQLELGSLLNEVTKKIETVRNPCKQSWGPSVLNDALTLQTKLTLQTSDNSITLGGIGCGDSQPGGFAEVKRNYWALP